MFNKSLVSPIALAFGLALTGAAAAQTDMSSGVMLGDQTVSESDLAVVQEHCDKLALAAETDAGGENAGEDASVELDEVDNNLSGVELESITLEQCTEAGLIDGPFSGTTPSNE